MERDRTSSSGAEGRAGGIRPGVWVDGLAVVTLGVVLAAQVLVAPIVGLANNGDFYRLSPQCGVYHLNRGAPETQDPDAKDYVSRLYRTARARNPQGFFSSSLPMMVAARVVNDVVRRDGLFDIRFLGGVQLLCLLAALCLFLSAFRRWSLAVHGLVAGLAVFALSDVGYFAYLDSFYAEAASVTYLLALLGVALRLGGLDPSPSSRSRLDAGFVACAVLFLTTKPQNAVLAPLVAAMWWALSPRVALRARSRLRDGVVVTLALLVPSAAYLALNPLRRVNVYNHIFAYILRDREDLSRRLAALGLGEEYSSLAGTSWWSGLTPEQERLRRRAVERTGYPGIARYYLHDPDLLGKLLATGTSQAFLFRPELGNFERARGGPPGELSGRLDHLTRLKRLVFPRGLLSMILAAGAVLLIALPVLWHRRWRAVAGDLSRLSLCLLAMSVTQLGAVLLGEADCGLVKHLFLLNALVDLLVVLCAAILGAVAVSQRTPGSRETGTATTV